LIQKKRSIISLHICLLQTNTRLGSFDSCQIDTIKVKYQRVAWSIFRSIFCINSGMSFGLSGCTRVTPKYDDDDDDDDDDDHHHHYSRRHHNHFELPVIQAKRKYPSGATRFFQHFHFIENNDVSIAARGSTQVRSHVVREYVRQ
jgi:hypothetical protein